MTRKNLYIYRVYCTFYLIGHNGDNSVRNYIYLITKARTTELANNFTTKRNFKIHSSLVRVDYYRCYRWIARCSYIIAMSKEQS